MIVCTPILNRDKTYIRLLKNPLNIDKPRFITPQNIKSNLLIVASFTFLYNMIMQTNIQVIFVLGNKILDFSEYHFGYDLLITLFTCTNSHDLFIIIYHFNDLNGFI